MTQRFSKTHSAVLMSIRVSHGQLYITFQQFKLTSLRNVIV